jgi:ribonuclease E
VSDSDTPGEQTPAADDAQGRTRTRTRSRRGSTPPPAADAQPDASTPTTPSDGPDDAPPAPSGNDESDAPVRRKVRSRRPKADDATAPTSDDSQPATSDEAPAAQTADAQPAAADASSDDAEGSTAATKRRRTRRAPAAKPQRVREEEAAAQTDAPVAEDDDAVADADDAAPGDDASGQEAEEGGTTTRRRRRGGRGRGRRGGRGRTRTTEADGEDAALDDAEAADVAIVDGADEDDDARPTRLQARGRGARSGTRPKSRTAAGSGRPRRPLGGVSEETRRAINEGPPRRMLVTVGDDRTQIAVLEDRTLVEHYVTRREDVSYVGNIYLGRVQNVLPGMEAAFVDIGKGRNGVLYAGEVNYDEADLDGDLPRIEQTLKSGQTVLVQVTKDPMGTKGARLTQHLSVAGRYCVLAPGDDMLGISRKLTDEERERLRKILKGLKPEGYGLIVRTAAEGATREQLETDIARLVRIWDEVETKSSDAKPLEPVYEEPGLVMRVIRDVFGSEYSDLIVDNEELAGQVRDYLSDVSPDFVDKVTAHTKDGHIFDAYEVTNQIRRALEKKVWLKSGGYLIIEKTEAMWVIDVNTGKFVGERNLEETVLRNNLEAATEIARQLRLRDMGGIIVIDFVDMLIPANRDEVLKRFRRELARDKTKSRVMEISKLGLVQMTRKNVSQGLQESFTVPCEVCDGRGAKIVDHMLE